MPLQSHFRANFLLAIGPLHGDNWNNIGSFSTYILLKPGSDYKSLEGKFDALMQRHLSNTVGFEYTKFEKSGNYLKLNLTPLKDIHLRSNLQGELGLTETYNTFIYFRALPYLFCCLPALIS